MLLSGTPANSRPVQPGDVVEVEVDGLGTLRNTIVEGAVPIRDDVGAQPSECEEVISTTFGGDWEFRGDPRSEEGLSHGDDAIPGERGGGLDPFYVDLLGFEVAEDYAPAMAIVRREDLTLWLAGPARLGGPAHARRRAAGPGELEPVRRDRGRRSRRPASNGSAASGAGSATRS